MIPIQKLKEDTKKIKLGEIAGINDITPEMMKYLEQIENEALRFITNDIINDVNTPKGVIRRCAPTTGLINECSNKNNGKVIENRIRSLLEGALDEIRYWFRNRQSIKIQYLS